MKLIKLWSILAFVLVAVGGAAQAQTSANLELKAAAASFYRMHVANFGFPLEDDLQRLGAYVSPELHALLGNELRRMREWSAQNPSEKPPVIEDLFICNGYEAPQNFRVTRTRLSKGKGIATMKFEFMEGGKVMDTCNVEATFVRINGKWLLDNTDWPGSADLRTLLSRKEYSVVPE